jgi:hypothetical protein
MSVTYLHDPRDTADAIPHNLEAEHAVLGILLIDPEAFQHIEGVVESRHSQREGDPYRALYDLRKEYELARGLTKGHAHNRAQRVMVKALFKDFWRASRRITRGGEDA